MASLAQKRPIFHSEADFQFSLAWEIKSQYPKCEIRLERPLKGKQAHLDILVIGENEQIAIELKYKTRKLDVEWGREHFSLLGHGAQDLGRYDILKDVQRIEEYVSSGQAQNGYTIFLTNDSAYWKPSPKADPIYKSFQFLQGETVGGTLSWGKSAGEGTIKGREDAINLHGIYRVNWQDYSKPSNGAYGVFRYVCFYHSLNQ
jgi:hypothetical protein